MSKGSQRLPLLTCLLPFHASADAAADGYASPYGEWRGQTQYQAMVKGESNPAAHAVINLTLSIEPGGKITGGSSDNGCRMLGIGAPGLAPHIVTLDVTLTGCTYAGFNRTYKGFLSVHTEKKHAILSLQALSVTPGKSGTFTIQSTMRR
jgi:hypothetical protein